MPKEDEKKEITLEELQQQIEEMKTSHQQEVDELKEKLKQKDLKITQLTLGATKVKTDNKVEDEPIEFDFDY